MQKIFKENWAKVNEIEFNAREYQRSGFPISKKLVFAWQLYNPFYNKDNQKIYLESARANSDLKLGIWKK